MASKNNTTPHDTLVKEHFQNPKNAICLLKWDFIEFLAQKNRQSMDGKSRWVDKVII